MRVCGGGLCVAGAKFTSFRISREKPLTRQEPTTPAVTVWSANFMHQQVAYLWVVREVYCGRIYDNSVLPNVTHLLHLSV